jgi:hypothetical protein
VRQRAGEVRLAPLRQMLAYLAENLDVFQRKVIGLLEANSGIFIDKLQRIWEQIPLSFSAKLRGICRKTEDTLPPK